MPLKSEKIPISFVEGVDEKTDSKMLKAPNLLELENAVYRKQGAIGHREGFSEQIRDISGGGSLSTIQKLDSFKHEFLAVANEKLYSKDGFSPETKWINKGVLNRISTESKVVVGDKMESRPTQDSASCNGVVVHAWNDTTGIVASVQDVATGNYLQTSAVVSLVGTGPAKVVCLSSTKIGVVFFVLGTGIRMKVIDTANTEAGFGAGITLTATAGFTSLFDITSNGTKGYLVVRVTAGIELVSFSDTAPIVSSVITAELPTGGLNVVVNGTDVWTAYYIDNFSGSTDVVRYMISDDDGSFTQVLTPTTIDSGTSKFWFLIAGVPDGATSVMYFYTDLFSTGIFGERGTNETKRIVKNRNGTTTGVSLSIRGTYLASKPFTVGATNYIYLGFKDVTQANYFLVNEDGLVVSRALIGFALNKSFNIPANHLPQVSQIQTSGVYVTHLRTVEDIKTNADDVNALFINVGFLEGSREVRSDFFSKNALRTSQMGDTKLFTGGYLAEYDRNKVLENNFHVFPEITQADIAEASGDLPQGTYGISASYVWVDANGVRHESTPSPIVSFELSGDAELTIPVPTLRLTEKENVEVTLYMTQIDVSGPLQVVSTALNNKTVDVINFVVADSEVSAAVNNRFIYTEGGVQPNFPPPSCRALTVRRDRIFALTEDNRIFFSKPFFVGSPLAFSQTFFVDVPQRLGEATNLASQDGRQIVFTEKGVFVFDGEGPATTGLVGRFSPLRDIVSPVGALKGAPVLTTDLGTFFMSRRGVELLTRQLQVQFVGASIEDQLDTSAFTNVRVTEMLHLQKTSEIVFVTEPVGGEGGDSLLVYNYFFRRWSIWKIRDSLGVPQAFVSGALWSRAPESQDLEDLQIATTSRLYQSLDSSFTDSLIATGPTPTSLLLKTGWIPLDGVLGFQRIRLVQLLGEYRGNGTLTIRSFYDYDESTSFENTLVFSPGPGVLVDPMELGFKPEKQKCSAVRYDIFDTAAVGAGPKDGVELSHIVLEIGRKKGLNRLPTAKTI